MKDVSLDFESHKAQILETENVSKQILHHTKRQILQAKTKREEIFNNFSTMKKSKFKSALSETI